MLPRHEERIAIWVKSKVDTGCRGGNEQRLLQPEASSQKLLESPQPQQPGNPRIMTSLDPTLLTSFGQGGLLTGAQLAKPSSDVSQTAHCRHRPGAAWLERKSSATLVDPCPVCVS